MDIESEKYNIPENKSLEYYPGLVRVIRRKGCFDSWEEEAKTMGFYWTRDIPTHKANWSIFNRPSFRMQNFPDGEQDVRSNLALYQDQIKAGKNADGSPFVTNRVTHMILRLTDASYMPKKLSPDEEFVKDIKAFTRCFIERPKVLGFPSEVISHYWLMLPYMIGGMALGSAAGYPETGELLNPLNALTGELNAVIGSALVMGLGHQYAKTRISNLGHYYVGENAASVLLGQREHQIKVAVQRELSEEVAKDGMQLNPDQFLERYNQMPATLVDLRKEEIMENIRPSIALPKMMEVARILQGI